MNKKDFIADKFSQIASGIKSIYDADADGEFPFLDTNDMETSLRMSLVSAVADGIIEPDTAEFITSITGHRIDAISFKTIKDVLGIFNGVRLPMTKGYAGEETIAYEVDGDSVQTAEAIELFASVWDGKFDYSGKRCLCDVGYLPGDPSESFYINVDFEHMDIIFTLVTEEFGNKYCFDSFITYDLLTGEKKSDDIDEDRF